MSQCFRIFQIPRGKVHYMNRVKTLSQQNLSFLLAIYIGIFLNVSVFYRRFSPMAQGIKLTEVIQAVTEVVVIVLFTFFILRLLSLGGRIFFRIVASLLLLISVAASYYMVRSEEHTS